MKALSHFTESFATELGKYAARAVFGVAMVALAIGANLLFG